MILVRFWPLKEGKQYVFCPFKTFEYLVTDLIQVYILHFASIIRNVSRFEFCENLHGYYWMIQIGAGVP